ncbi:hypothetical protein K440DRAFT_644216 [Wilcoxina mikolae CBS 423.85]|nr:hypothetical protein K440DRAFT_644216 [Wilcoxina mikolae CBS 423.85]
MPNETTEERLERHRQLLQLFSEAQDAQEEIMRCRLGIQTWQCVLDQQEMRGGNEVADGEGQELEEEEEEEEVVVEVVVVMGNSKDANDADDDDEDEDESYYKEDGVWMDEDDEESDYVVLG